MNQHDNGMTRRTVFAAGALGAVAVAGFHGSVGTAAAAEMTAGEKANVALVNAFCKAWGDKATTIDRLMADMTDDCSFKLNGQPATIGKAKVAELFKTFFKDGTRYDMKILETFAKGPVVVHARIDTTVRATKTDEPGPIVGIYVFKDAKIQEWEEVIYKA